MELAGLQPRQELPRCNLKPAAIPEGKERLKNVADHSGLVGGKFNRQRERTYEAYLRCQRDEWTPAPACQILSL